MTGRRRERDAVAIAGDYQLRALDSPRPVQRFWHRAKIRAIDRLAPARAGARLADAGCGSGVIAAHLARTAGEVVGFDSNPEAVQFARGHWTAPGLRFVLGPFEQMIDERPFDQIYCLEVLEHLYPEQAVETLRLFGAAAGPGATLFVSTPNARSAWPLIEWTLDRLKLVPTLDEAQHLTLFTAATLREACARAGWTVTDLGTFNGAAPFVSLASEPLALGVERLEHAGRHWLPGHLLYCVARWGG